MRDAFFAGLRAHHRRARWAHAVHGFISGLAVALAVTSLGQVAWLMRSGWVGAWPPWPTTLIGIIACGGLGACASIWRCPALAVCARMIDCRTGGPGDAKAVAAFDLASRPHQPGRFAEAAIEDGIARLRECPREPLVSAGIRRRGWAVGALALGSGVLGFMAVPQDRGGAARDPAALDPQSRVARSTSALAASLRRASEQANDPRTARGLRRAAELLDGPAAGEAVGFGERTTSAITIAPPGIDTAAANPPRDGQTAPGAVAPGQADAPRATGSSAPAWGTASQRAASGPVSSAASARSSSDRSGPGDPARGEGSAAASSGQPTTDAARRLAEAAAALLAGGNRTLERLSRDLDDASVRCAQDPQACQRRLEELRRQLDRREPAAPSDSDTRSASRSGASPGEQARQGSARAREAFEQAARGASARKMGQGGTAPETGQPQTEGGAPTTERRPGGPASARGGEDSSDTALASSAQAMGSAPSAASQGAPSGVAGDGPPGSAAGGSPLGRGHRPTGGGHPTALPLTPEGSGPSRAEAIEASAAEGFAAGPYRRAFADYGQVAERLVDSNDVPVHRRELVRRYFDLIRPRSP